MAGRVYASNHSQKLEILPVPASGCSIFRVPARLRQENAEAYTPKMVSIGPLHYGTKTLEDMEKHKRRYLKFFLDRTQVSLEYLVKHISKKEESLRKCYAENINLPSNEFVEMILVDSAFVVEILLRHNSTQNNDEGDHIFGKLELIHDLWYDFWLLENQLPFSILQDVLEISKLRVHTRDARYSLIGLTLKFLKYGARMDTLPDFQNLYYSPIEHLIDFFLRCLRPQQYPKRSQMDFALITPCATKLQQAGVKFLAGESKNLFDVHFDKKIGKLVLPKLKVTSMTENYCRNLLAFERYYCTQNYLNDYVIFLDRLVDTSKDVDLLVEKGIIEIWTGHSEEVATYINELGKLATFNNDGFYFSSTLKELNKYCKSRWSRYRASLVSDYLTSPDAHVTLLLAILALLLTFIQTVTSIMSIAREQ